MFDQDTVAHAAIAANPIIASGWEQVSGRMTKKNLDESAELENTYKRLKERFEEYGGNKSFSLGNHIRNVSQEARELAFCYRMTADGSVMHNNSLLSCGELETDGFIARVCLDSEGRLVDVSLHNGSLLHYRGVCLFSSLLKCDAAIKYAEEFQLQAELSGDAWCYYAEDGSLTKNRSTSGTGFDYLSKRKLSKGSNFIRSNNNTGSLNQN